jgi:hypothetical protein
MLWPFCLIPLMVTVHANVFYMEPPNVVQDTVAKRKQGTADEHRY